MQSFCNYQPSCFLPGKSTVIKEATLHDHSVEHRGLSWVSKRLYLAGCSREWRNGSLELAYRIPKFIGIHFVFHLIFHCFIPTKNQELSGCSLCIILDLSHQVGKVPTAPFPVALRSSKTFLPGFWHMVVSSFTRFPAAHRFSPSSKVRQAREL